MQEQKVVQTVTSSAPKSVADTDMRRYRNKDAIATNREQAESTEHIYRSIFGDVS